MNQDQNFSRTKIIGTLGPATRNPRTLSAMIDAGLDVVRLNCSHSGPEELKKNARLVREVAGDRPIAILADLGGPKIRLADLSEEIPVKEGEEVVLTANPDDPDPNKIKAGYPRLAEDVQTGARILIDDGLIQLEVTTLAPPHIHCKVLNDGILKSRKGLNLPGTDVSLSCITEKDKIDLAAVLEEDVDFIALSFVRRRQDIQELRALIQAAGKDVPIVAKIEKPEAVEAMEEIVEEADVVMVARGDLGVEMPPREVPVIQKRIISECLRRNTPVITATQMLDSMITNPRPTRAEASDVANAVMDGSDAVMLSGETSVGRYPIETVNIMNDIILSAQDFKKQMRTQRRRTEKAGFEESICHAATTMAEDNQAAAIICLTNTGRTARRLAGYRSRVPVLAYTHDVRRCRYLNLVWGVRAELIGCAAETDEAFENAVRDAKNKGYVQEGDTVVFTAGIPLKESPHSNMLKIHRVPVDS
ncbi:MAG: pyruvate kinase [Spirochaetales bacterium]|nr:pyruvate kinase [Spirochaetales bacterium]